MNEASRVLLSLLPLVAIVALIALAWGPMRRLRERDKASPPSLRTVAFRMVPVHVVLVIGAVVGLIYHRYEFVVWAVLGIGSFAIGMWRYSRKERLGSNAP